MISFSTAEKYSPIIHIFVNFNLTTATIALGDIGSAHHHNMSTSNCSLINTAKVQFGINGDLAITGVMQPISAFN